MNQKTYGLIAGLIAAGVSTWWWRRLAASAAGRFPDRGTVIFDNTPQAGSPDGRL